MLNVSPPDKLWGNIIAVGVEIFGIGIVAILSTPDGSNPEACPIEIEIGDSVTDVTGMHGEVISCYPADNSVRIYTSDEYRQWTTDKISDSSTITWSSTGGPVNVV